MRAFFFFLLAGILTMGLSCQKQPISPTPSPQDFSCNDDPEACDLVKNQRTFGYQMFKELEQEDQDKNIFISPFSISTALSMTLNGADGNTRTEMLDALAQEGWNIDSLNEAYQTLIEVLGHLDEEVQLEIANAIFSKEGFEVKAPFLNTMENAYNSEVQSLDFFDPGSVDIINNWVDVKTHGLITSIINEISPDAVMFLLNAIYFKGNWQQEFDPNLTSEGPFYLENGLQVLNDMMTFEGKITVPYYVNDDFQAIDLAYGDSIYSMTILLPKEGVSTNTIVNHLNEELWQEVINGMSSNKMYVQIPKFEMGYEKKLNKYLQNLGMIDAFNGNADFSNINDAYQLFISFVKHKSFIKVDEVGTEAAAVTIVGVEATSANLNEYFTANKPFVFAIRDNQTGSILFWGKLMNPHE